MKNLFYFLFITSLCFNSCKNKASNNYENIKRDHQADVPVTKKTNKKQQLNEVKEDFTIFIGDFSSDAEIQRLKIADNATDYLITDSSNKKDSTIKRIDKKKWNFIKLANNNTLYTIYDNFYKEIYDTDERVFVMDSVKGNGASYFYFKRLEGKWYLAKRVVYLKNKPGEINNDFEAFLKYFSSNNNFQRLGIANDAIDCDIANEGDSTCEKINKAKWRFIKLVNQNTFNFIYSSFNIKMNNTNERVFSIINIEGPGSFYYFKRKDSKWLLVNVVDYED